MKPDNKKALKGALAILIGLWLFPIVISSMLIFLTSGEGTVVGFGCQGRVGTIRLENHQQVVALGLEQLVKTGDHLSKQPFSLRVYVNGSPVPLSTQLHTQLLISTWMVCVMLAFFAVAGVLTGCAVIVQRVMGKWR